MSIFLNPCSPCCQCDNRVKVIVTYNQHCCGSGTRVPPVCNGGFSGFSNQAQNGTSPSEQTTVVKLKSNGNVVPVTNAGDSLTFNSSPGVKYVISRNKPTNKLNLPPYSASACSCANSNSVEYTGKCLPKGQMDTVTFGVDSDPACACLDYADKTLVISYEEMVVRGGEQVNNQLWNAILVSCQSKDVSIPVRYYGEPGCGSWITDPFDDFTWNQYLHCSYPAGSGFSNTPPLSVCRTIRMMWSGGCAGEGKPTPDGEYYRPSFMTPFVYYDLQDSFDGFVDGIGCIPARLNPSTKCSTLPFPYVEPFGLTTAAWIWGIGIGSIIPPCVEIRNPTFVKWGTNNGVNYPFSGINGIVCDYQTCNNIPRFIGGCPYPVQGFTVYAPPIEAKSITVYKAVLS